MLPSHTIDNRNVFSPQQVSIDFDGTSERLNKNNNLLGIADTWSVAKWWNPGTLTATTNVVHLRLVSGGAANEIRIQIAGSLANDPLRITNANSSGSVLKDYRWNSLVSVDTWFLTVYTWNGTDMLLIHDGVDQGAPDSTGADNAGTMSDTARDVGIGASSDGNLAFDGRIHSVGIWDSVLSAAECLTLFNSGAGSVIDWSVDSGSYVSSASLQHWWRCGKKRTAIGADSPLVQSRSLGDINLDAASGITTDDIVADFPGIV